MTFSMCICLLLSIFELYLGKAPVQKPHTAAEDGSDDNPRSSTTVSNVSDMAVAEISSHIQQFKACAQDFNRLSNILVGSGKIHPADYNWYVYENKTYRINFMSLF